MPLRTRIFVFAIVAAACMVAGLLYLWHPVPIPGSTNALIVLCGLAVMAEMLLYVLPRAASGSIAFIAYQAMLLVVPSWTSVVAVACVKCAMEILGKRARLKVAFNTANHALVQGLGTAIYLALGGQSFLLLSDASFIHISLAAGLPAIVACVMAFATNTLLVSAAISITNRTKLSAIWHENNGSAIALDLLCASLVIVFAWVYVSFGWIAAVALWVPILGVRQVHKTNLELEVANQDLLQLMVKSIEARDPYTSGHSRRVQSYSLVIARGLGLRGKEVERIGTAALLHDVGKIYEKYAPILSKPGRLTADEWATMKEHPIDSANLVATITRLSDIIPAIRHHHESWDGTGYPDALVGEEIPLASRIITFADTIDAMTTERPYRPPMSEQEVRTELVRCRGKQFDPEITDRLLSGPMWETLFHKIGLPGSERPGLALVTDRERNTA
jgi:hypothetical protein